MSAETGPAHEAGLADDALHFRLTALLKWRRRYFDKSTDASIKDALALLPFFFCSSFKQHGLDVAPPGIQGFKLSSRLRNMRKRMGVPPELDLPKKDTTISALVGHESGEVLDVYLVYRPGAKADALDRVKRRLPIVQSFLSKHGCRVRFFHWETLQGTHKDNALHHLLFKGFFIAGQIPKRFWQKPNSALSADMSWKWFQEASNSPLQQMALFFLLGSRNKTCGDLLWEMVTEVPIPIVADQNLFVLLWAANATSGGNLLTRLLLPLAENENKRAVLLEEMRLINKKNEHKITADNNLETLLLEHHQFVAEGKKVLNNIAPAHRSLAKDFFTIHILSHGVPPLWKPLYQQAMRGYPKLKDNQTPWHIGPQQNPTRNCFEITAPCGAVVARGATAEQAIIRSLFFLFQVYGQIPILPLGNIWRKLGQFFESSKYESKVLMLVDGLEHPGPPNDLLNRGPKRLCTLKETWFCVHPKGRRPSLYCRQSAAGVFTLHRQLASRADVHIQAIQTSGEPILARLNRLLTVMQTALSTNCPLVIEVGGTIWRHHNHRWKQTKEPFAKPNQAISDPEAPDINTFVSPTNAPQRTGQTRVLDCAIRKISENEVFLLFHDPWDFKLTLRRPLSTLNTYLNRIQSWMHDAKTPLALKTHIPNELAVLINKPQSSEPACLPIKISGSFPNARVLTVQDNVFDEKSDKGLKKAIQHLYNVLHDNPELELTVDELSVSLPATKAEVLFRLYAAAEIEKWLTKQINQSAAL